MTVKVPMLSGPCSSALFLHPGDCKQCSRCSTVELTRTDSTTRISRHP